MQRQGIGSNLLAAAERAGYDLERRSRSRASPKLEQPCPTSLCAPGLPPPHPLTRWFPYNLSAHLHKCRQLVHPLVKQPRLVNKLLHRMQHLSIKQGDTVYVTQKTKTGTTERPIKVDGVSPDGTAYWRDSNGIPIDIPKEKIRPVENGTGQSPRVPPLMSV